MLREDPGNKALAEQFGFANEFYFSRRFRQVMKCTPTEFKRRLLANIVPPNTPSIDKRSIHFGATSSDPAPGLVHPPPKSASRQREK